MKLRVSVTLLPFFRRPSKNHTGGTASLYLMLSVQNWWQVSYALSVACNPQVTLAQEKMLGFFCGRLLLWDSIPAMKAEGTNVLDIYKRPPNCRPEEKPLIMHYPAHAGLVSAARTASCTGASMCRMETNILKKLQLTKGEKIMNSTLLFWYTVLGAGKDIKTLEPHPYCASELTSGTNPSVVRRLLSGFSQLIWSIAISLCTNCWTACPLL